MICAPRRSTVLALTGLVLATAALTASLMPGPADAHGSTRTPASRVYSCRFDDPDNPMCAAAWSSNSQALYDWMEVNIGDAAGRHRELIPDGQLCSAGRQKYAAFDQPGQWPVTNLRADGSGLVDLIYENTAPHSTAYYRVYLTGQGFDARTDTLNWSDLQLVFDSGPLERATQHLLRAPLPNRGVPAVLYIVWQRSDSPEAFYACSDVTISGGSGSPPTTGSIPSTSAPVVLPTTGAPPTTQTPSTTASPPTTGSTTTVSSTTGSTTARSSTTGSSTTGSSTTGSATTGLPTTRASTGSTPAVPSPGTEPVVTSGPTGSGGSGSPEPDHDDRRATGAIAPESAGPGSTGGKDQVGGTGSGAGTEDTSAAGSSDAKAELAISTPPTTDPGTTDTGRSWPLPLTMALASAGLALLGVGLRRSESLHQAVAGRLPSAVGRRSTTTLSQVGGGPPR